MHAHTQILERWVDVLVEYAKETIHKEEINALICACDGDISERSAVIWIVEDRVAKARCLQKSEALNSDN